MICVLLTIACGNYGQWDDAFSMNLFNLPSTIKVTIEDEDNDVDDDEGNL